MSDIIVKRGPIDFVNASVMERVALSALSISSHILEFTHFKGYGRVAKILRNAAPERYLVLKLDTDCSFRFPFGDAYWSRLLAPHVVYEPEILSLFRLIRNEDYRLIDCGANFGYWSILVSGEELGGHEAVAIEASPKNVDKLARNSALNGGRFMVTHAAVADIDGGFVSLDGPTHEGLAIVDTLNAGPDAERAPRISLDGLMSRMPILQGDSRLVLKLDVEGVEEAALKGASQMLARDTLLIYEEQGSDKSHGNTRFVSQELGMSIFIYQDGFFKEARTPIHDVAKIKRNSRRGYNIVATRSHFWRECLRRTTP